MSFTGVLFRLLFKAMLPLVIVAGLMFYLMYLNGQNPLRMIESKFAELRSAFADATGTIVNLPDEIGSALEGGTRTFHKWQDASGGWHYGETPPADARSSTAISIELNQNVVQAYRQPEPVVSQGPPDAVQTEGESMPLSSPYSPGQIKKLFEDARQLQETLDQRQEAQNSLFGIKSDN